MMRWIAGLTFVWTLVAAPALCAGGWIEHVCACASPSASCCDADPCHDDGGETDAGETDGGRDTESRCDHEASCPEDPCSSVARPARADSRIADDGVLDPAFDRDLDPFVDFLFLAWAHDSFGASSCAGLLPGSPPLDLAELPYPVSDRPLVV